MYFDITRDDREGLTRRRFEFILVGGHAGDTHLKVKLASVATLTRPTRRHKFVEREVWVRGWTKVMQRRRNQIDEFPGCPDDVKMEAMQIVADRTCYEFDPL